MMKSKNVNSVSLIRKSSQTPLIGPFKGPEKVSLLSGLNKEKMQRLSLPGTKQTARNNEVSVLSLCP